MLTRAIPKTHEQLPVIGLGTWENFDVGPKAAERPALAQVLEILLQGGGRVIDSSPMYGKAEGAVGELLASLPQKPKPFIATKVWTEGKNHGIVQMERSFKLLNVETLDLMQVHNLVDWQSHLHTLQEWKAAGRVRYIGITHYTESAYVELERVMRAADWDFVQLNYSLDERAAEARLLPLAAERGIAVIVNRPLGGGGLIRRLVKKPLPGWASEQGWASWAELLLKFILANPAVTCVIPGTGDPAHMAEFVRAGEGPLPDAATRDRMIKLLTY